MDKRLQEVRIGDVIDYEYQQQRWRGTCIGWADTALLGRCVIVLPEQAAREVKVPLARILCRYRLGAAPITFN